tara:strand:- start:43 stop:783 length:741 start_codon:yes stop_codon:yes gene_type:complete
MKKPIYIISDNHFLLEKSKKEKSRREKMFKLFSRIKETGGTLVIGGDFFDFWLQSFYGVPKYYEDILVELKKLNDHNVKIHYVVGNHDYWDFGFIKKKCGIKLHKTDFIFNIDNKKMLLTHGDGLLKNDYLYRFMKKIIRSIFFVFLVRLIPSFIMSVLARKISNTKSKFNKVPELPLTCKEELKQYATNHIKYNDFDSVLMGHYHQLGIEKINNGFFVYLGDWINEYTVTIFNKDGKWTQESYKE